MRITFERVSPDQHEKVAKVYELIRDCGREMLEKQGLSHWGSPYPLESVQKDCEQREVFLAVNLDTGIYVHTFQLEFFGCADSWEAGVIGEDGKCKRQLVAEVHKFCTAPKYGGMGIGTQSMNFIEEYCRSRRVSTITLDVYEKSKHAINFYEHRGFVITGRKNTRRFVVFTMENHLF